MKKWILISLTLLSASLACLQPAATAQDHAATAAPTFVKVAEEPAGAVYEIIEISEAVNSQICAVVIAEEALHLRAGPSEGDIVLTWLKHGDVLKVIDWADSNWWLVDFNGRTGYARSIYLAESECE